MVSSETRNRFSSGDNQLSLNFLTDSSPSSTKTRIADHVHAITSGKITFHPDKSEIGESNFALKISYMGGSYLLNGIYSKEQIRPTYQEDFSATVIRIIRFDSILAFRDGHYNVPLHPGIKYKALAKSAYDILSHSCYNTTIH